MIRFRPKVVKIKWVYKLLYSIFIKQGFLFKALIPTGFDLLLKILPQKYQVRQKHTNVRANTLKKKLKQGSSSNKRMFESFVSS
jgi:hypothetical protein